MNKNKNDLPDGFEPVESPPRIILHFNPNYKRLYISKYVDYLGLAEFGSTIGVAYNVHTNEILFDKQGTGFKISKDGHLRTKSIYDFLYRRCIVLGREILYFELDYTKDTDRFLIFKLIDKSPDFD